MEHTEEYRALLAKELALVTEELQSLGVQDPHNPTDWIAQPEEPGGGEADDNVAADRAEELEEREATLADLESRFNAVKAALARLEAGSYGACEICTQHIEHERLLANPAARTCIHHRDEEQTLVN